MRASTCRASTLLIIAACAGDFGVPVDHRPQTIIGGGPETSVSGVAILLDETTGGVCSSFLVTPRHLIAPSYCYVSGNSYVVGFGANALDTPEHVAGVMQVMVGGPTIALPVSSQVAVIELTADVPSTFSPLPVLAGTINDTILGQTVRAVGYGISAFGLDDSGQRRSVTDQVDGLRADFLDTGPIACSGDQGGPLLLDGGAGAVVVGVSWYGDPTCGSSSSFLRWDRVGAYVAGVIGTAGEDGGLGAPDAGMVAPDSGITADAGTGGEGDDGGCGCRVAGGARAAIPLGTCLFLVCALILVRRRRR